MTSITAIVNQECHKACFGMVGGYTHAFFAGGTICLCSKHNSITEFHTYGKWIVRPCNLTLRFLSRYRGDLRCPMWGNCTYYPTWSRLWSSHLVMIVMLKLEVDKKWQYFVQPPLPLSNLDHWAVDRASYHAAWLWHCSEREGEYFKSTYLDLEHWEMFPIFPDYDSLQCQLLWSHGTFLLRSRWRTSIQNICWHSRRKCSSYLHFQFRDAWGVYFHK